MIIQLSTDWQLIGDKEVGLWHTFRWLEVFFILISFQALSRVFWKFKIWPPGAFRWIFWHGRIVSDQVQVRFHKWTYFLVQICKKNDISLLFTAYIRQNNPKSTLSWPPFYGTHELHHVIKIVTNFATACF